jgi:hypothetical protein
VDCCYHLPHAFFEAKRGHAYAVETRGTRNAAVVRGVRVVALTLSKFDVRKRADRSLHFVNRTVPKLGKLKARTRTRDVAIRAHELVGTDTKPGLVHVFHRVTDAIGIGGQHAVRVCAVAPGALDLAQPAGKPLVAYAEPGVALLYGDTRGAWFAKKNALRSASHDEPPVTETLQVASPPCEIFSACAGCQVVRRVETDQVAAVCPPARVDLAGVALVSGVAHALLGVVQRGWLIQILCGA